VCLTSCGNYCLVGSKGGVIYVYNAQSGLARGSFPQDAADPAVKKGLENVRKRQPGNVLHERNKLLGIVDGKEDTHKAGSLSVAPQKAGEAAKASGVTGHTADVTGVFVDITNSCLVSVGMDGLVIFWNFATHAVVDSLQLSSPQMRMEAFKEGDFVCTVGQDRMMRLFDVSSRKLCRRFDGAKGHGRAITDMAFTPDCRRLLSCSLDCTVRVWDIPTSRCLSWMKFDAPLTSLCMSLSGEYMCVTLADREGIHMYIDRSLYETVHFWHEPTKPSPVGECRVVADDSTDRRFAAKEGEEGEDEPIVVGAVQPQVREGVDGSFSAASLAESTAQRGDGSITMAALPKAYWITLFNLEAIKERNRPLEAPKAPPQAPFFLPTVVRSDAGADLTPSFPTPQEYAKLVQATGKGEVVESSGSGSGAGKNKLVVAGNEEKEEDVVAALAQMGSVWNDEDGEGDAWGDGGTDDWGDESGPAATGSIKKRKADTQISAAAASAPDFRAPKKHQSRILRRQKELPR
jgi:U3 small nucleolar RNA-associated protein 21